jgi:hypothetical protein
VDYEEGEVQCPHCNSTNIEQRGPRFPPSPRRRAPETSRLRAPFLGN